MVRLSSHLSSLLFTISVFAPLIVQSRVHHSPSESCGVGLTSFGTDGNYTELHNKYRNKLRRGRVPNQPKPKHLEKLKFDQTLADEALKIAKTCKFEHKRVHDSRWSVGQNLHVACKTPAKNFDPKKYYVGPLKAWYGEHKRYHYPGPHSGSGHYTQIMWHNTKYVGCAHAIYKKHKEEDGSQWACILVVCNYGPAGNYVGQPPYELA